MRISDFLADNNSNPARFILIVAVVVLTILFTQGISDAQQPGGATITWETSYDQAVSQARENDTPILLYFHGSDWCPWSQKLSREVFSSAEFGSWMESRVVPVALDFTKTTPQADSLKQQNQRLLERYRNHLTGFPTALFINADGTVIGKLGYLEGGVHVWTHHAQPIIAGLDKST